MDGRHQRGVTACFFLWEQGYNHSHEYGKEGQDNKDGGERHHTNHEQVD